MTSQSTECRPISPNLFSLARYQTPCQGSYPQNRSIVTGRISVTRQINSRQISCLAAPVSPSASLGLTNCYCMMGYLTLYQLWLRFFLGCRGSVVLSKSSMRRLGFLVKYDCSIHRRRRVLYVYKWSSSFHPNRKS